MVVDEETARATDRVPGKGKGERVRGYLEQEQGCSGPWRQTQGRSKGAGANHQSPAAMTRPRPELTLAGRDTGRAMALI
jgi:hypothetical protein